MMKIAQTQHPVHALIAGRWSPYAFSERPVASDDLRALFEAARWAPSSYNEQPWRYIVASREQGERFEMLLSCLVEANRIWASKAPVLALGVVVQAFERNGKPNKAAVHDLGLASAHLTFEATARGLAVHQMIGIEPDRARELYRIPAGAEALTALAIGYAGDPDQLPENLRPRDLSPRVRKPLHDFVFGARWGEASPLA
jgi:nitroreductase